MVVGGRRVAPPVVRPAERLGPHGQRGGIPGDLAVVVQLVGARGNLRPGLAEMPPRRLERAALGVCAVEGVAVTVTFAATPRRRSAVGKLGRREQRGSVGGLPGRQRTFGFCVGQGQVVGGQVQEVGRLGGVVGVVARTAALLGCGGGAVGVVVMAVVVGAGHDVGRLDGFRVGRGRLLHRIVGF